MQKKIGPKSAQLRRQFLIFQTCLDLIISPLSSSTYCTPAVSAAERQKEVCMYVLLAQTHNGQKPTKLEKYSSELGFEFLSSMIKLF